MKKIILSALLLLASISAWAQFSPGQILTAAALNSQFALYAPLSGSTFSGAISTPTLTVSGVTSLNTLSTTAAPTFGAPVPLSSGGTGAASAAAALANLGLGTTATPTFYGLTLNGSTAHGLVVGGGNGVPVTFTSAGTSGQVLTSNGASADPTFQAIPWGTPGAIGATTPSTGAFTALSASSSFSAPYSLTFNNPSATTIQGKLNQIVNFTDFHPTCDGTTLDQTAWNTAISTIGSTPTTLVVSCPSKINAALTFSQNTQLWFKGGGEIIGTAGTELVQVQQQIVAGRTQIFSNLSPQADVSMMVFPEWFGGYQSVADSGGAFNTSYGFLKNVGGIISMAGGTYAVQTPITNVQSKVALIGVGKNATVLNFTGTNLNGISAAGVLGTPISNPSFKDFSITSATAGTSNTGLSLAFTTLANVQDVQANGFFTGFAMECATDSAFTRAGATFSAATNGFTGWSINGGGGCTGGNESSTWRDTYVSGTGAYGGPTGQIGYKAYGAYVSDLEFDNAATAETNYGYDFDYSTAAAGGYADVHVNNPIVDGYTQQAILVGSLPAQQMITIAGGWLNPVSMLAETDGLYVTGSLGHVNVSGTQIGGEANYAYAVGARVINSSNVKISGASFQDNKYALQESGSTGNVYIGNSVSNTSAHAGAVDFFLTGSTGSVLADNTESGYSSFGVQVDVTSSSVAVLGNTASGGNITTPVQNNGTNPIGGGYTGTGLSVLQNSPTITTPTINGITSGVAAGSGVVGQPISNSTSGTAITSGTTVNATSISVPAGDWDCEGHVDFVPATSAVVADIAAGLTTTSVTLPSAPDTTYLGVTLDTGGNGTTSINTFRKIVNVSTSTPLYAVAYARSVTGATASVNGAITCRRAH